MQFWRNKSANSNNGYQSIPNTTSTTTTTADGEGVSMHANPDDKHAGVNWSDIPAESKERQAATPEASYRLVATLVCLALVCGGLFGGITGGHWRQRQQHSDLTVQVPTHDASIDYRPLCEYYDDDAKITMIQTSMKEPSQQWSSKPCYQANAQGKLQRSNQVLLDSFGSPDAVLQVSFSQAPFASRDTPILGFGGAFTEAAALNYQRLTATGQDAVMKLLFSRDGLGYTIGRIHMNSCDFSVQSYSFDDTDGDFALRDFDVGVHHDVRTSMVDMALRATSIVRRDWTSTTANGGANDHDVDGKLRMFASPWSPPAWMKKTTEYDDNNATHGTMDHSAVPNCLKEGTGPDSRYAKTWALYFSKYLTAYEQLGLPFWGITVQNEPEFPAPWEACAYAPINEAEFVQYHLGPKLAEDHPDVKILIFDHNKDHVTTWTNSLLSPKHNSSQYVAGTGYHWYASGMDRLLDGAVGQANLHRLQANLENHGVKETHLVLGTESCHCPTTGYAGGTEEIYWARAERYVHAILADLAAGSHGWVEWNLILDSIGGPNHLGNLCESTILSVPHRAMNATPDISKLPDFEYHHPFGDVIIGDGRTREELNALGFPAKYLDQGVVVQPIYYYMGHISRYVRPGSHAVMGIVRSSPGPGQVFRPDGQVVMGGGQNDLARNGIEITVWPCEGSTRQQFRWNVSGRRYIEVDGHDWLGNPTKSCIGNAVDPSLEGLTLADCSKKTAGAFDLVPLTGDDEGLYNIVFRNHTHPDDDFCLGIRPLENNGGAYGPRGGAQVVFEQCYKASAKWNLDRESGEAISAFFADETGEGGEVCLTTGWPFLQVGAFLTPHGESSKTVVVLNEARDPANLALREGDKIILTGSIPPRSIQTYMID